MYTRIMDIINTILSVAVIVIGIIGLVVSQGDGYFWAALIVGVIWLIIDIIKIKIHQDNGNC